MPKGFTLDDLVRVKRELDILQMERELDILLQDNGPALLSLMHGGRLMRVNGQYYVVNRDLFFPGFRPSASWEGKDSR